MAWLDSLQPASFRGVPFHVDDISHQAGQTVVVREYPFQDLPTVFSMGEAAEEIKFSAYVVGDDYIEQRDALRDVLEGEGVLVHPTAGSLRVYVAGRFSIKENPTYEGGIARFDLTFIRAEARRYPANVESTQGDAEDAADEADAAAQDQFAADFDTGEVTGWVAERAESGLWASLSSVWDAVAPVIGALGDAAQWVGERLADWQTFATDYAGLLTSPPGLAARVSGLFALPPDVQPAQAARFAAAFAELFDMALRVPQTDFETAFQPTGNSLAMFGVGDAAVLGTDSAARAQLMRLNTAAAQLIETLAVSAYVRTLARSDLGSYDETMAARARVHAQCNRLLLRASSAGAPSALPSAAWHDAVAALQGAALRDLQARSRDLVRLTTYTPQSWQPAWFVSYRLYGTAQYVDEIMTLNPHIRHPLLVPPGKALRVQRRG